MADMKDERREVDRRRFPRAGGRRAGDPPAEWLSIQAYAECYGAHPNTVAKWVRSKILEVYRIGRMVRIRNIPPDQHRID